MFNRHNSIWVYMVREGRCCFHDNGIHKLKKPCNLDGEESRLSVGNLRVIQKRREDEYKQGRMNIILKHKLLHF